MTRRLILCLVVLLGITASSATATATATDTAAAGKPSAIRAKASYAHVYTDGRPPEIVLRFEARLTDALTGMPLPGRAISFFPSSGGMGWCFNRITDAGGDATCDWITHGYCIGCSPPLPTTCFKAKFWGNEQDPNDPYGPSSDEQSGLNVNRSRPCTS